MNNQQSNPKQSVSLIKWGLIGVLSITISYFGYREIRHAINPCESPRGRDQRQSCYVNAFLEDVKRKNQEGVKLLAQQYATRPEVRERMPHLAEQYPEEVKEALAIEAARLKIMSAYKPERERFRETPNLGRPRTEQEHNYLEQVIECAELGKSVHGCPVPINNTPESFKQK